jgi:hypothetical protein
MLHVENSASAPHRVYRSFRAKLRYDIDHEKGWSEHITNVGPIKTVTDDKIFTVAGDILEDVDASAVQAVVVCWKANRPRSSSLQPASYAASNSAVQLIVLSTKHLCSEHRMFPLEALGHLKTWLVKPC